MGTSVNPLLHGPAARRVRTHVQTFAMVMTRECFLFLRDGHQFFNFTASKTLTKNEVILQKGAPRSTMST